MSSGTKGGARHFRKPYVDTSLLFRALLKHENLINDLKAYEILSRNSAVDPRAMYALLPLVEELLELEPSAEVHPQPLRAALLQLLGQNPHLNNTQYRGSVWVELRAARVATVLFHVRRLARSPHMPSLINALTASELATLQKTLKKVVVKEGDSTDASPQPEPSLKKEGALPLQEGSPSSRKKLRKTGSDVSVDSKGFPKMLASPSPQFLKKKGKNKREPEDETSHPDLKKSLGLVNKKPASLKKEKVSKPKPSSPKKKKGLKKPGKKASLKKPAMHGASQASLKKDRLPWVKILKTTGKKPERCYLLGAHDLAEKPRLIVEVTKAKSNNYSWIIDKIWESLKKDHLTKEEALQMREDLCAKFP